MLSLCKILSNHKSSVSLIMELLLSNNFHMNIRFTFLLICLLPIQLFSQSNLSIEDYMSGKYHVNKPEEIQWIPGTRNFSFILDNALQIKNADSVKTIVTLPIDTLWKRLGNFNKKFPEYKWIDSSTIVFQIDSSIYVYNNTLNHLTKSFHLPFKAENIDIDKSLNIAYTIGNNLFVMDTSGKKNQVTNNISCVTSGGKYVFREEFGTTKATFWSPDGDALAYYSNNELKVKSYPRLDFSDDFVKESTLKYPFAGGANQLVTIYTYNLKTKKRTRLLTGEVDHFLTNITWSPDGQHLYLFDVNREQSQYTLRRFDVKTGNRDKNIVTEKSKKYVEPVNPIYFINHTSFLYVSRTDGYNKIYWYQNDTLSIKAITKPSMEVNEVLGIENHYVYYSAIDQQRPLEEHLFKTQIETGNTLQLSTETGVHSGIFNESNGLILDGYSSLTNPGTLEICDIKNKTRKTVFTVENPFTNINFPTTDLLTIKAADDSTLLYGSIIKPAHFDTIKCYPVIVNVYGGPHIQMVRNEWMLGNGFTPYYLASKGFIVFILDSRGSSNRGLAFESCTWHKLGTIETADQLKGVEYLKKQSYIDSNRIGLYGESFGGFMTLTLMEQAPTIFKVGVCGSPVTDWKYYEVMYGERYMGTPQSNPLGYATSSTVNKAKNITGKLLLTNGGLDHITVINNSMAFLDECIKNNIQIDYFLYPNHDHHVIGKDRIHFLYKISNYFIGNL